MAYDAPHLYNVSTYRAGARLRTHDQISPSQLNEGKPLQGVRVLALEQMQALPFATQLLARLGADVIKVEPPNGGDSGRGALPTMADPQGRAVGATFLRNNLNKRSICINLREPRGRQLVLDLAARVDIFAENFKAGRLSQFGLGYEDILAVNPATIYLSVSGFGQDAQSPYGSWPAYAPVVEAMTGLYEMKRREGEAPRPAPGGSLGDLGTSLFATIAVLSALLHRQQTGEGQHLDIAMLDSTLAMTDIITNYWSLGSGGGVEIPIIMHGFKAADGWFILQVGRRHQFEQLATAIGRPEWLSDHRFDDRQGWVDHLDAIIRPAIEAWAERKTKMQVCQELGKAGLAAGPCLTDDEVVHDRHVALRDMLVEMPRPDGEEQPVLFPNNPIKMSAIPDGPIRRVPWLGEHTDEVLTAELSVSQDELTLLRSEGVIA
jgi:crotonobetainyl-CoA:carnitine CoA-transferase CaiB-like acyl-CoA transferase